MGPSRRVRPSLPAMVLGAAIVAVCLYAPWLGGGRYTDDFVHVERLRSLSPAWTVFTSPDAFGFYRPLAQASLYLDVAVLGGSPVASRLHNLFLHVAVLALAAIAARQLLGSDRAAFFTLAAYLLTPKAHPQAVMWASARAELLMSAFALGAVVWWIAWLRRPRVASLAASALCYAASVGSKETAVLLPAFCLLVPSAGASWRRHLGGIALWVAAALVIVWARSSAGALMPWSNDPHYELAASPALWLHNGVNYFNRAMPAPAAFLVLVSVPAWLATRAFPSWREVAAVMAGGLGWFVLMLAPAVGIRARSELYLYLPVLGLCAIGGWLTARTLEGARWPRTAIAGFALAAVTLVGFQNFRTRGIHRDLAFSAGFAEALRAEVGDARPRYISIEAADAPTAKRLRDSLGYVAPAVRDALNRDDVTASLDTPEAPPGEPALRLVCRSEGAVVRLTRR